MELTPNIKNDIIAHCVKEVPHQACGLVLFDDNMRSTECIETINYGAWPYGFQISPDEMLGIAIKAKGKGKQVKGVYHCHLASNAKITGRDKFRTVPDGMLYIIVSVSDLQKPELRCYHKIDGSFIEIS